MTNSSTKTVPRIYSLLSIGQRGVGKTVFLVGSCIELYTNQYQDNGQQLWFDYEDAEAQQILENILRQVSQTGEYPAATMKISNFDFTLKMRNIWGTKTLCQFRWWDPPGESCQIYNPAFLMMVLNSDGYCSFIDARNIVDRTNDPKMLSQSFEPVKSIADMINSNNLQHPIAIVLTKCDLVRSQATDWQILEKNLQPLKNYLKNLKINYKFFYSSIPIVSTDGMSNLITTDSAAPILWLVSKLRSSDNLSFSDGLINPVN